MQVVGFIVTKPFHDVPVAKMQLIVLLYGFDIAGRTKVEDIPAKMTTEIGSVTNDSNRCVSLRFILFVKIGSYSKEWFVVKVLDGPL